MSLLILTDWPHMDVALQKARWRRCTKKRVANAKATGFCAVCFKRPKSTGIVCVHCKKKHAELKLKRYHRLRRLGICVDCGKVKAKKSMCPQCARIRLLKKKIRNVN